jgi:ribonuclease D
MARLLPDLARGPLAVDAEGDSLHHYPEKVCLIQLGVGSRGVLVDPLAELDVRTLGPTLGDPALRKILHGADYDLRVFQRDFGIRIRGLFDTMVAARLVGERAFGLSALLERYFDVRLDKRFQRADWSRRPLTPDMERYAALDTLFLARLSARLEERLEQLGRVGWAEEEFARLEAIRWSERVDPEAYRRVKGSVKLGPRQLAVLRSLHAWREAEARRRDRPPFRVLRDERLLQLAIDGAVAGAGAPEVAGAVRGGRARRELQDAIREALDLPAEELPAPASPPRRRPPARRDAAWRRLRAERDRIAQELDLEPSVVASRAALEQLLAQVEAGSDPAAGGELRRWQLALLLPGLRVLGG